MVVEVSIKEKESDALPGCVNSISVSSKDENEIVAEIKSGSGCKRNGPYILLFLVFLALLVSTIYFGILARRYKHELEKYHEWQYRLGEMMEKEMPSFKHKMMEKGILTRQPMNTFPSRKYGSPKIKERSNRRWIEIKELVQKCEGGSPKARQVNIDVGRLKKFSWTIFTKLMYVARPEH